MIRRALIGTAAWLVPAEQRGAWRAEWLAELWHAERRMSPKLALLFCLGSFKDALWLRRNNPAAPLPRLKSPGQCLALLAALASVSLLIALIPHAGRALFALAHPSGDCYGTDCKLPIDEARNMVFRFPLAVLFCACIILPVTTGISLGEISMPPDSAGLTVRFRRWLFFAAKILLILAILAAFSLAATQTRSILLFIAIISPGMQFGGVFALRWAVRDQRARCPVCLRLMSVPVDIGQPSHCLIEWERTELICLRGHGFLQVPGVSVSWRNTQSWHYLDPGWSSLFTRD